jgi:EAL domain-containing protein (putative c-di-GMP-specific phosphodiesterase class I)
MRQGIEDCQFELDYQPIIHIPTNTVLAIESLARWNHPDMGRLLPEDFIRVAEHTGLIDPLTSFVVERALTDWPRSARPDDCGVAVNVSPHNLHQSGFPARIRELLDAHGLPATALVLEITENLLMADPDRSVPSLDKLHEMGVRLVIDDFGKGYSSLSYLRRLPVDEIKIDPSFIVGLAQGEDDTLVRTMIELAHNLGMTVVAEGVESDAVLQQLAELNCDAAQGYCIIEPGKAHTIADWIHCRPAAAG